MTFRFSGFEWKVKEGERMGPGPNRWDKENVRVDKDGRLHLAITEKNGVWSCGEVQTVERYGFGEYRFHLTGRVDRLDRNIVFGIFHYPPSELGPDATNEIDIEFARWGNDRYPNGNYTVWPAKASEKQTTHTFEAKLKGETSTQMYVWRKGRITFASQDGHQKGNKEQFADWSFQPADPETLIAQKPMPLLLNLWLFQGKPPSDGKPVEIIIDRVEYRR